MNAPDYRARIAALNPRLNAFVDETREVPGDGLCWGVKSNIAVAGLPHTAGIEAYADTRAMADAETVNRIRRAGGTVLGTVNMHEGALGATTDNAFYGCTHNPWAEDVTPGGSSGGSGAAVAAGLCDVALGSDTMGSVRIPAAYCGVQGHKPTTGLVPTEGVIALSTTLDHVGPLARDIETLWQAMHVLAEWGPAPELAAASLRGLRIGVWDGDGAVDLTPAVAAGFAAVCEALQSAGAKLSPMAPPVYDYSRSRRAGLLISEVEGAGVHGVSPHEPDLKGFTPEFMSLMKWGVSQPQSKVDAAYAHISDVRTAAASVWADLDVVIAPTAPQEAFRFDASIPANQADFTAWADFAALPATAIFTGLSAAGLPLSAQVIGPEGDDRETLQVAAALEGLFGKPPMPPGFEW